MKIYTFLYKQLIIFCLACLFMENIAAQNSECVFKDTIFNFNFGSSKQSPDLSLATLKNYKRVNDPCPEDGYYAFTSKTSGCFYGDWITLTEDHTPGDAEGNIMLVNAAYKSSVFFIVKLNGFKPSTRYEFSVWLMNVCKLNSGCPPMPPNILITLETSAGKRVAEFQTGQLVQLNNPYWKRYAGMFTTAPGNEPLLLTMRNLTTGGCGNDFAMDDIVFRECYPPIPEEEKKDLPVTEPVKPVVSKPTQQETEMVLKKKNVAIAPSTEVKKEPVREIKNVNINKAEISLPAPLRTRENLLIKKIESTDGELLIQLYDNGEIDGDTISIYHNNELIVSHAALSAKPIEIKLKVDKTQPHHELVMVADNLGSIPPNTSLMIVTGNNMRYEVFISSSEQKNARIVIDRKAP